MNGLEQIGIAVFDPAQVIAVPVSLANDDI